MKQTSFFSGLLLSALACSGTALALDMQGTYLNMNIDVSKNPGLRYTPPSPSTDFVSFSSQYGMGGGLAWGSQMDAYRLEAALNYWTNDVKNPRSLGISSPNAVSGQTKLTALMVNGYYDFDNQAPFSAYVGLGMGLAHVDPSITFSNLSSSRTMNHSSSRLAYQGILGLNWTLTEHLKAGLDYRYFMMARNSVNVSTTLSSTQRFSGIYKTHRANLGLTYYLN